MISCGFAVADNGILMGANMVREKVRHVFIYAPTLPVSAIQRLVYISCPSLQCAIDNAFSLIPEGSVEILLCGGDCLPVLSDHFI